MTLFINYLHWRKVRPTFSFINSNMYCAVGLTSHLHSFLLYVSHMVPNNVTFSKPYVRHVSVPLLLYTLFFFLSIFIFPHFVSVSVHHKKDKIVSNASWLWECFKCLLLYMTSGTVAKFPLRVLLNWSLIFNLISLLWSFLQYQGKNTVITQYSSEWSTQTPKTSTAWAHSEIINHFRLSKPSIHNI